MSPSIAQASPPPPDLANAGRTATPLTDRAAPAESRRPRRTAPPPMDHAVPAESHRPRQTSPGVEPMPALVPWVGRDSGQVKCRVEMAD